MRSRCHFRMQWGPTKLFTSSHDVWAILWTSSRPELHTKPSEGLSNAMKDYLPLNTRLLSRYTNRHDTVLKETRLMYLFSLCDLHITWLECPARYSTAGWFKLWGESSSRDIARFDSSSDQSLHVNGFPYIRIYCSTRLIVFDGGCVRWCWDGCCVFTELLLWQCSKTRFSIYDVEMLQGRQGGYGREPALYSFWNSSM